MKEPIEKLKAHFRLRKDVYVTAVIASTTGVAVTLLIVNREQIIQIADVLTINVKSPKTINQVAELVRRGHPGNNVICNETGEAFASQNRAAELLNLSPSKLSRHLNGTMSHVDGYTFTKIGEAS